MPLNKAGIFISYYRYSYNLCVYFMYLFKTLMLIKCVGCIRYSLYCSHSVLLVHIDIFQATAIISRSTCVFCDRIKYALHRKLKYCLDGNVQTIQQTLSHWGL